MDASIRGHDGRGDVNPPRLIPLVVMLILVIGVIWYLH